MKYYLQYPPNDHSIVFFEDLPEQVKEALIKDKRLKNIQVFSNGQVVAENNYKLLKKLHNQGFSVICFVSLIPNPIAEQLSIKKL